MNRQVSVYAAVGIFFVAAGLGCAGGSNPSLFAETRPLVFCATESPTAATAQRVDKELLRTPFAPIATKTIPVYFHVVTSAEGIGEVSDTVLANQVAILNTAFAGGQTPGGYNTSFRFVLTAIDRTANSTWFTCARDSADEVAMKTALRRGTADDLNLYIRDLPEGLMGYGGFPWNYAAAPHMDGPVIDYTGMPGGSNTQFNLGDLAVHEVGHWLGLLHTFEGGCSTTNDGVSDTPAQANYNWNCPVAPIDTCTGTKFKGTDPTMNFLDYTTDSCKYQFTAGQNSRMVQCWTTYRANQ